MRFECGNGFQRLCIAIATPIKNCPYRRFGRAIRRSFFLIPCHMFCRKLTKTQHYRFRHCTFVSSADGSPASYKSANLFTLPSQKYDTLAHNYIAKLLAYLQFHRHLPEAENLGTSLHTSITLKSFMFRQHNRGKHTTARMPQMFTLQIELSTMCDNLGVLS